MASGQPKVAKIERADADLALDTIVRAFLAVGGKIRLEPPDLEQVSRTTPAFYQEKDTKD
jgi:hypothetical protein